MSENLKQFKKQAKTAARYDSIGTFLVVLAVIVIASFGLWSWAWLTLALLAYWAFRSFAMGLVICLARPNSVSKDD